MSLQGTLGYIFLKKKSVASHIFLQFQKAVENQLGFNFKFVQTDGGGKFKDLTPCVIQCGINHRLTFPYPSEQNGIVKRKHCYIVEMSLTLLKQASLPMQYCSDSFVTTIFLVNRLPSKVLNNLSPHEKHFSKTPDYAFLRVFGCLCFPLIRPFNKHKLDFRFTRVCSLDIWQINMVITVLMILEGCMYRDMFV